MTRVLLTYFKPTGKYYTSGKYNSKKEHCFEIFEEVEELARDGVLPGLIPAGKERYQYDILVNFGPDNDKGYPALIKPYKYNMEPKRYERIN